MEAHVDTIKLLQWYVDIGADEAILDSPVDRTMLIPAVTASAPTPVIDITKVSSPQDTAPAPLIGAVEALGTAQALAAAAQNLEDLKQALENFQGMTLKRTATQIVFADGTPQAKIMIIGEAPSADDDRAGRPFVGVQGQLLDKMFAAIGLNRDEHLYITHLVNWYPPGNRAVTATELALSIPFVQRHIELINPDILIFLGGTVAKSLLQSTQPITRLRGKWAEYSSPTLQKPVTALPFLSPSYLLATPAQKQQAWADLLMLKARLKG